MAQPQASRDRLKQAIDLQQQERLDEAAAIYEMILVTEPKHADALHLSGVIAYQKKDYRAAESRIGEALKIKPGEVMYLVNMAAVHKDRGELEEAEALYKKVLAKQPAQPQALYNLGVMALVAERFAQALPYFERAVKAQPNYPRALAAMGSCLTYLNRYEEAHQRITQSLSMQPTADGWVAFGMWHKETGKMSEAVECFSQALALDPSQKAVYHDMGMVFYETGHLDEALAMMQRGYAATGMGEFLFYAATVHLVRGEMEKGFALWDHRWDVPSVLKPREFACPRWHGENLTGKTIVVWGEQGVGDEVMFASLLPNLGAGKLIIETSRRLDSWFARSFPEAQVLTREGPVPEVQADYHCAAGDMWRYVQPYRQAYLKADEQKAKALREKYLRGEQKKLVGLSWRSAHLVTGKYRSLTLDDLLPILQSKEYRFVNLQYAAEVKELEAFTAKTGIEIINDASVDPLGHLDGFAAQVAAMDHVLTVANTTVHVAGALGVPTTAILAMVPSWRYGLTGDESRWYGKTRLVRQQKFGEWSEVVERAKVAMEAIL